MGIDSDTLNMLMPMLCKRGPFFQNQYEDLEVKRVFVESRDTHLCAEVRFII